MKKNLFFVALAAMTMVSCSNDETVEFKQDEVRFNVVADNASRASELYSSDNLHDNFYVAAAYRENASDTEYSHFYIPEDQISYESGAWVNKTTSVRYWPQDENLALDFYALNIGTPYFIENAGPNTTSNILKFNFCVNHDVKEQRDILYASAKGQTKAANAESGINLNFRHALSQIVFNAVNKSASSKVVIKSVQIANVWCTANVEFNIAANAGDTQDNYTVDQEDAYEGMDKPLTINLVTHGGTSQDSYIADFEDVTIEGGGEANLTNGNKELTMLLLPQTQVAWAEVQDKDGVLQPNYGAYFLIDCELYNIGVDGEEETDYTPVYTGKVKVPVEIAWNMGTKYIYTFIFGAVGGSGSDIFPTITYNITVDDFYNGSVTEVPVHTGEDEE